MGGVNVFSHDDVVHEGGCMRTRYHHEKFIAMKKLEGKFHIFTDALIAESLLTFQLASWDNRWKFTIQLSFRLQPNSRK